MLNESRARTLQDIYLISRHPAILGELQKEAKSMCRPLIHQQLKRTGASITGDRIESISYESSVRFIEMYLKDPEWYCRYFAARLNLEVLYFLYTKKVKNRENEEELDDNLPMEKKEESEDTRFVIEDIMSDTVYWRNVLINCYKSKSYKKFILSIEPIVGKRWIYDHAKRLHNLYIFTRRF